MEWLTEPFSYAFFGRALLSGVVVGAMCAAVGVFVVLRRMSYIGHGLSHSVLGGVAVALAFDVNLYWGAAGATVVSALLVERISRRRGLHADAAIGIVTTAMFALGLTVISLSRAVRVNLETLLFGNVLGVDRLDLLLVLVVAALFAVVLFVSYKRLLFVTFDPLVASMQGVRAAGVDVAFNLLVAAVVIVSLKVLGVTLIAAAIVIPPALARLAARTFSRLIVLATVTGALSAVAGLYLSYYVEVPSGAAIVLVEAALFLLVATITAAAARTRLWHARRRLAL